MELQFQFHPEQEAGAVTGTSREGCAANSWPVAVRSQTDLASSTPWVGSTLSDPSRPGCKLTSGHRASEHGQLGTACPQVCRMEGTLTLTQSHSGKVIPASGLQLNQGPLLAPVCAQHLPSNWLIFLFNTEQVSGSGFCEYSVYLDLHVSLSLSYVLVTFRVQ